MGWDEVTTLPMENVPKPIGKPKINRKPISKEEFFGDFMSDLLSFDDQNPLIRRATQAVQKFKEEEADESGEFLTDKKL